jgi:polysaccharide pyruvyl transferase WcaK-like protein
LAERILRYAKKVYIRDKQFTQNLITMGVNYEKTKDLSAYMQTEPWGIDIEQGSIGLNVSGLAYSNQFRSLSGEFENYPELIERIIEFFQRKNRKIYLIPHSYNYNKPENNNDDMVACRLAYNRLRDKKNVILVDKELTSPQVKFLISKMSFFIGTRMHANFAAIYTNVPLFGLAYSYKFKGAFDANGLDGDMQTAMINNITLEDIDKKVNKIGSVYNKLVKRV